MLARFGITLEHDRPIAASHGRNFRSTSSGSRSSRTPNVTRPRRACPLILLVLCIGSLVSLVVWAAHSRQLAATAAAAVAAHTLTTDCVSAEQMARRYGWTGDWRAFAYETQQLNGWERWPLFHLGEQILVPDYRTLEGGPTGPPPMNRATSSSTRTYLPSRADPRGGPPLLDRDGPPPDRGVR